MQVNILEAKNQLSRLVKAALAGEEVIIAKHGVPAVRLHPVPGSRTAPSLAEEMADLRQLLREEGGELRTPPRANRAELFPVTAPDEDRAD